MTRRRQHSSLGDMVSTAAFLGMSIYLLLAGFEFKADGRLISAIGVWIACGFVLQVALDIRLQKFTTGLSGLEND